MCLGWELKTPIGVDDSDRRHIQAGTFAAGGNRLMTYDHQQLIVIRVPDEGRLIYCQ